MRRETDFPDSGRAMHLQRQGGWRGEPRGRTTIETIEVGVRADLMHDVR